MATIGIDLGTTNTVMSVVDEFGNAKVIPSSEGEPFIPTTITFENGEDPIVGREAVNQQLANPTHTFYEFKLLLALDDVQYTSKSGTEYTAKDFVAEVLKKVSRDCEQFLGEPVESAAISVPANFSDAEKKGLLDAAEQAGLTILQLVHEPTAAAIAYAVEKGRNEKVLVLDLGGGTFDVSIVECDDGSVNVLGTDGIADLGGRKFTHVIQDFVLSDLEKATGYVPGPDTEPAFFQDLRDRAEQAKYSLGVKRSTKITLSVNGSYHTVEITADEFNDMITPFTDQIVAKCESLLHDRDLDWESIDKVLLVGGGNKVPKVKEEIEKAYDRSVSQNIDAMKAISYGAAIQAAILSSDAYGHVIYQGRVIPAPKVNIRDVTSHGIGVVIDDANLSEVCAIILPKNTPIPSEKKDTFRFKLPEQNAASIDIIQGEEGQPRDECEQIGNITLDNLPLDASLPRRICVCYAIDKNGMCVAYATDEISGKKADLKFNYAKRINRAAAL